MKEDQKKIVMIVAAVVGLAVAAFLGFRSMGKAAEATNPPVVQYAPGKEPPSDKESGLMNQRAAGKAPPPGGGASPE
jgi:hypothetical protein